MLEEIMHEVNNYFLRKVHKGKFEIAENSISLPFLQNGQYFRIVGSVFNDGVYKYPVVNLKDETFCGEVWELAIPSEFVRLSNEIKGWMDKYGASIEGPYTSESFGGYSYSKSSGADGGQITWASQFRSRLSRWRKI